MRTSRNTPFIILLTLAAWLSGCAQTGPLDIDRSISARSHSSRVQFVVLHYTSSSQTRALALLSQGAVSSHYLITDDEPARILQLVDEHRSAWHAGESAWRGRTWLNATSIGIEIVNPGYRELPGGSLHWHPYTESQITAVIALLQDIVARHGIDARNIVGHSDIAPQRKQDPGPLFPWQRLADLGLGLWYDAATADAHEALWRKTGMPNIAWFQEHLARVGYEVPRHGALDEATRAVLSAFQMRYRPEDIGGMPDARTAAILAALSVKAAQRPEEDSQAD